MAENQQLAEAVLPLKREIALGVKSNPRSRVWLLNNLLVDRRLYARFAETPTGAARTAQVGQESVGLFVVHRLLQDNLSDQEFDHLNTNVKLRQQLTDGAEPGDPSCERVRQPVSQNTSTNSHEIGTSSHSSRRWMRPLTS